MEKSLEVYKKGLTESVVRCFKDPTYHNKVDLCNSAFLYYREKLGLAESVIWKQSNLQSTKYFWGNYDSGAVLFYNDHPEILILPKLFEENTGAMLRLEKAFHIEELNILHTVAHNLTHVKDWDEEKLANPFYLVNATKLQKLAKIFDEKTVCKILDGSESEQNANLAGMEFSREAVELALESDLELDKTTKTQLECSALNCEKLIDRVKSENANSKAWLEENEYDLLEKIYEYNSKEKTLND